MKSRWQKVCKKMSGNAINIFDPCDLDHWHTDTDNKNNMDLLHKQTNHPMIYEASDKRLARYWTKNLTFDPLTPETLVSSTQAN